MRNRFVTWGILLTAFAACGGGNGGGTSGSPESIGTLAYVVTECRENADAVFFRYRLEIRQGDAAPLTVREITPGPILLPGLCQYFGERRWGSASVYGLAFQRLGVSPDGSRVAFELTDDFSIISKNQVPPEEEGIYVVRSDGSGLQWLASASRQPTFYFAGSLDFSGSVLWDTFFRFSPSGDRITYPDRWPDDAGEEAVQIATLDLNTGKRMQVTHLHPQWKPEDEHVFFFDSGPVFLDEETIGFSIGSAAYSVKADGQTEPVPLPPPLTLPGSSIAPGFSITGSVQSVYPLRLPGTSDVWELFVSDQENLLQLTNFGRDDTAIDAVLSRDRRRVLFVAADDQQARSPMSPFGSNPYKNCQFFSVDTLGGDLRQLTNFNEGRLSMGEPSVGGCTYFAKRPDGCNVIIVGYDPDTDTIVFESSCDPCGTNPNGDQIFAMQFDGAGLRQLTNARGLVMAADGSVTVELPGPAAYPGSS